uniref:transglutaminase domain-containing protein n=1 Tax=uncultured Clostridium sp. TaxID=59620 RepID=UPI00258BDF6D
MIRRKGIHKLSSILLMSFMLINNSEAAFCSTANMYNLDQVQQFIYEEMLNRQEHITFNYKGDKSEFINNISERIKNAYKEDSYTERAWLNIEPKANITRSGIETDIKVVYLTSKEQEDYINNEVDKIIQEIIKPDMTDEQKIQAVNQYLINRYEYDYDYISNNPYEALMTNKTVCQGYSMTTYKILNKLNIECKIVVGSIGESSHSWNAIKLNGLWYYLDVTNNDALRYNKYFLVDSNVLVKNGYIWNNQESVLNN